MPISQVEMETHVEAFDAVDRTFNLVRFMKELNFIDYQGGAAADEFFQQQSEINKALLEEMCNQEGFLLLPAGKTLEVNGETITLAEDYHAYGIKAKGTVPDIYGRSVAGIDDDLKGFFEKISIRFHGASRFAGYQVVEYNSNTKPGPGTVLGHDVDGNEVGLMGGRLFRPYTDFAIKPYIFNTWEDGANVYHSIDTFYAFLLGSDPSHPDAVMQNDIYQYFTHNSSPEGAGTYSANLADGLYEALYHFPLSARIATNLAGIDPDETRFGWSGGVDQLRPDCYAWLYQLGAGSSSGEDGHEPIVMPVDVAPPSVPLGGIIPMMIGLWLIGPAFRGEVNV